MPIPNPNNGYVPKKGEKVKIVGNCHPRLLGKIVEIIDVYMTEEGWWHECKYFDDHPKVNDFVISGGLCGGLEPIMTMKV